MYTDLFASIDLALARRVALVSGSQAPAKPLAIRVFDAHTEGDGSVTLELFDRTLVISDNSNLSDEDPRKSQAIATHMSAQWPWLTSVLLKARRASEPSIRAGTFLRGGREDLPTYIEENGVKYAVDLLLHQDTSLYLDTEPLRAWLTRESRGRSVLNTFAYTGSLGIAALAGGASRVLQVDRSARFLALAARSQELNGFKQNPRDLIAEDVFRVLSKLKSRGSLVDLVLLDPPFFSQTDAGTVDLVQEPLRLLDKVQPLVGHNGRIVLVHNALFLSGNSLHEALSRRCDPRYLSIESRIDATCWGPTPNWPADPAPYNHPTKITVLRVLRKDQSPSNLTVR